MAQASTPASDDRVAVPALSPKGPRGEGAALRADAGDVGEAPEAYVGYDREWRIVALDEGARSWMARMGQDPDALLGRVVWDAFPTLRGSVFQDEMGRAMRDRVPVRFVMPSAASHRWFETVGYPTADGVGAFSREVTASRRAERMHRVLADAGRVLGDASLDVEATLLGLTALAIPDLADWCFVDEAEPDGGFVRMAVAHADPAHAGLAARLRRRYGPKPGAPAVTRALETGRSVVVNAPSATVVEAAARDADHLEVLRELALHSSMIVPLAARGRVLGSLSLCRGATPADYDEDDLAVAEELARRAATALDTARLYRAAEAAALRTARLQEVTAALSGATRVDDVARAIVQQGLRALGASSGAVLLREPGAEALDLVFAEGYPPQTLAAYRSVPLGSPVPATEVVRTGEPVFLSSAAERLSAYPALAGVWREGSPNAVAALPLALDEARLGSLVFNFREVRGFDAHERRFLAALAQQCAQALERARLYEAERGARERTGAILESIDDAFASFDAQWRFRYVNAAAASMAGTTPAAVLGRVLWEVLDGATETPLMKAMRRVMESRHTEELDSYSEVLGGRWLNARVYPAEDGGVSVFYRDITEQHRAGRSLRENESRLRSAVDVASLALWSVDLRTGVTTDSPRLREIVGAPAEADGPVDWQARIHPDDLGMVTEAFTEAVEQASHTGTGAEYRTEHRLLHADGTVRWLAPIGQVLCDAEGVPVQVVGVARDITERVLAETEREEMFSRERELRLAAERSAARTARLQRVTALLAGARPTDEVAALFVREARDAFAAQTAWLGVVAGSGEEMETLAHAGFPAGRFDDWSRFPVEGSVAGSVVRERSLRWFVDKAALLQAFPERAPVMADVDQEALAMLPVEIGEAGFGVVGLGFAARRRFSDEELTFAAALAGQCGQALERARLYEAERQARAEAEEANRAKSAFLATVSHELRTPLNAIGGYAELLEIGVYGALPPEQMEVVRRVQRSQRHLLSLINDVLQFARLEAGHLDLSVAEVECRPLLEELEPLVAPQLAARGVAYAFTPPAEGLRVRADAEKVRQVMLNLVSNAIKFTPAGGRISVSAAPDGDAVRMHVLDTGVGIAPEHLDRVFDAFVQVGRTLNAPAEGVGLGLAISRDLARAMGGDLSAESTPGAGSTFTLTLPRA